MYFYCRVDGCANTWQAHDSSNSRYPAVCQSCRRMKRTIDVPVYPETIKEFSQIFPRVNKVRSVLELRTVRFTKAAVR
jgi:hypothetical protein